jgi:hypothetical protein
MNFCWIGLRFGIVNSLISVCSEITILLAKAQEKTRTKILQINAAKKPQRCRIAQRYAEKTKKVRHENCGKK